MLTSSYVKFLSFFVCLFLDNFRVRSKGLFSLADIIQIADAIHQLDSSFPMFLLRSKNTLKQGKFLKFLKLTAKPKVMENLKRSWKKSWKVTEFEEHKKYEPC